MQNSDNIIPISEKLQLESLMPNTKTGVIVIDSNLNIVNINSSALRLLDIEFATLPIGSKIYTVLDHNEANSVFSNFTLNGLDEDSINFSPNHKQYSLRLFKKAIKSGNENLGFLFTIKKETLGKKYKEMTEGFVASVSHELKTPLTLIMGAVETLQDGALKNVEEAEHFIDIIKKHSERLHMLISDILSLSSLDQDVVNANVNFSEIDLSELVFTSTKIFEYILKDKKITLEVSCPEGTKIKGNQILVEQALINLIDNGCKYTNEGGHIFVSVEKNSENIHVSVRDTGIGIAEKDQIKVFERFYRVDKEKSRNLGGTGLGLSIVKQIVKIHNGSISLQSVLGQGSTFTLILPRF